MSRSFHLMNCDNDDDENNCDNNRSECVCVFVDCGY